MEYYSALKRKYILKFFTHVKEPYVPKQQQLQQQQEGRPELVPTPGNTGDLGEPLALPQRATVFVCFLFCGQPMWRNREWDVHLAVLSQEEH